MVSTGRGGAGNIQNDAASNSDKKVFYSTGRGGAGNIQASNTVPSPKLVPQGSATPQLSGSKVTTGRGGYGNMIDNNDPQLVRKLQDVDGPVNREHEAELSAVTSNMSFSVGRGGFGNVISKTKSSSSNMSNGSANLYTISSRGKKSKKGFFEKIKEAFHQKQKRNSKRGGKRRKEKVKR